MQNSKNQFKTQGDVNMSEVKTTKQIDALYWGGVLLWAGVIFAAESFGVLPQVGDASAWSWIFLGAGVYGLIGNFWRMSSSNAPNPTTWDWIWSGIFIIIGLSGFFAVDFTWPLILILVGVGILVRALVGQK
jgi:hypothetical protein